MKRKNIILILLAAFAVTACNLDYYPETEYNEGNVTGQDDNTDEQYTTREDILGARNTMYENIKWSIQEAGFLDLLVYSEVFTDNAYSGSNDITVFDNYAYDADHKNVERDWNYYMARVSDANEIITYIEGIQDVSLTDAERREWKAEATIWRAWNWYQMSLLWGDIPMVDQAPPVITAENIEEVYHLYYPDRVDQVAVFEKIVEDLLSAVQYAPSVNPADKFVMSKAVAYGLLAKVYAEAPIQDYGAVAGYCTEVENMNLELVDDYDDLWAYDLAAKDVVMRHSSESIFEVPFTISSGHWVWMMFWRDGLNSDPNSNFSWSKWICPARNLSAAFEAEGDDIRYEASVVWDAPSWSTRFYDSSGYPFMYKLRSNANSIIKMRLAEIYLLHAEALAHTGNLSGAAAYVDRIRDRVGLAPLTATAKASPNALLDAILKERRLELAFEGHRWFDLKRFGKAIECANGMNNPASAYYDSYKPAISISETRLLLPVPGSQLDNNPSLTQNQGY